MWRKISFFVFHIHSKLMDCVIWDLHVPKYSSAQFNVLRLRETIHWVCVMPEISVCINERILLQGFLYYASERATLLIQRWATHRVCGQLHVKKQQFFSCVLDPLNYLNNILNYMYSITVILLVIQHGRSRYPWSTGKRKTPRKENPLKMGNSDRNK